VQYREQNMDQADDRLPVHNSFTFLKILLASGRWSK
jgi:hypothetical protein